MDEITEYLGRWERPPDTPAEFVGGPLDGMTCALPGTPARVSFARHVAGTTFREVAYRRRPDDKYQYETPKQNRGG